MDDFFAFGIDISVAMQRLICNVDEYSGSEVKAIDGLGRCGEGEAREACPYGEEGDFIFWAVCLGIVDLLDWD